MLWSLVGCAHALPEEQPCLEVGTALGSRTEQCTGDQDLALARIEAFEEAYACELPEGIPAEHQADLYECALIVRNLACELVLEYGDDLDLWLQSSPTCGLILVSR
jgi:hypothetical protein